MASFDGAGFAERGSGGQSFPVWNKKTLLSIKPLPNGTPLVQDIGMDVQRLALIVKASGAELAALYDKVFASGSLVYGWETHDAFLESIESVVEVKGGADVYYATLNLVRL